MESLLRACYSQFTHRSGLSSVHLWRNLTNRPQHFYLAPRIAVIATLDLKKDHAIHTVHHGLAPLERRVLTGESHQVLL